jgi:hypothetical protein
MEYQINVSLKGVHFFAASDLSIRTMEELRVVHKSFVHAFPESKGYTVRATRWQKQCQTVGLDD